MKINGMPIQTAQKQQAGEGAGTSAKAVAAESKEAQGSEAAVLSVSQRNAVSVDGETSEMSSGTVSNLLKMLAANPESTGKLHASLSPERVLHLLG